MRPETVTIGMIRAAVQSFGDGGQEVSNAQLYEALGLESEPEKVRMRSRIAGMIKHGEVSRVRDGVYVYNSKHRPREAKNLEAIWRFVRKAKPGWSVNECALMTRVSYTHVLRYCAWLEDQEFVARVGKNDRNAVTYRGTRKADQSPETPYPPHRATDPFSKERVAAATIARLLLCADPYAVRTGREIVEACGVLLGRFGNGRGRESVTENENEEALS